MASQESSKRERLNRSVGRADREERRGKTPLLFLAASFGAAALFFCIGGATLMLCGGSWYYLLAGFALLAVSISIACKRTVALPLYGIFFAATVAWSVWEGSPYYVFKDRFLSPIGVPCQEPPFGTMTAIDLKTQRVKWQIPMGTVRDTGPLGIKMGLSIPVGMPTIGGSMATESGPLFFAASLGHYLRAMDTSTGDELWKARLPVGSQATPITYQSSKTGKQYVLMAAGGARQSTERGDYIIAYALPTR